MIFSKSVYFVLGVVPMNEFFRFQLDVCHYAKNVYCEVMVEACVYLWK